MTGGNSGLALAEWLRMDEYTRCQRKRGSYAPIISILGGKIWENLHLVEKMTRRKLIITKARLLMHWLSLTVKPIFSWWAVHAFEKLKKRPRWQLHPYPRPRPFTGAHQFWHVGSRAEHNQCRQILSQSVQGFRSPRWSKIAIFHWLEISPLQQRRHTH